MRLGNGLLIAATIFLCLASFSWDAGAGEKIGILIFGDEVRYEVARQGFTDKLKEEGYAAPHTRLIVNNAGANKARAAELVREYAAGSMDLIVTFGTSITVPVAREIKDTPIVFGLVYNPVEAGIAKDWKSSGNNTTGATTIFPMAKLFDRLMEFRKVGRLAVLYTSGEKNSEAQLKALKEAQSAYGVRIVPVPLTRKEEIRQILPEVVRTSDALFISGSNLVNSEIRMIVDMATKANVVTITHLDDLVAKGVLLGVCTDSYRNGRLAGEKAIRILKGEKPSSIPIESPGEITVMINMETAKAGRFPLPEGFMKRATVVRNAPR